MKKFLLLTILFFAAILFVHAQNQLSDEEKLVQQTVTNMFQALAGRDMVQLKYYCKEDILILENGSVWNLDTLVQKVSQITTADFKRINKIEFIETKISGKVAWTTYHNQAEITTNGKSAIINWLETAILMKEDGRWKIKTLHVTLLKKT